MLNCLEICAGGGGQAIGLHNAGFRHVALIEYEKAYCEVLRENRPDWNIICQDVRIFSGLAYKGEIDLLAGGVPCPPFSAASKQLGREDERDLFPQALRLVEEIMPKAVMLENVRGFLSPRFESYRAEILERLFELGFNTHIALLNACNYGVPQSRPRVVIVGMRKDQKQKFEFPPISRKPPQSVGICLKEEMGAKGWKLLDDWIMTANGIAPAIVGGSKKHGGPDLGPTRARKKWARMGVDGMGIADAPPDENFVGMPRLTNKMIARLQGFPPDWIFGKRKTIAYRMLGNAFPPPVAEAVGRQIRICLDG